MAEKVGGLLINKRKREIVFYLKDGPKRVGQIAKEFNMTQRNVCYYLDMLRLGGYVQKKEDDKIYSLTENTSKIIPIIERVLSETSKL